MRALLLSFLGGALQTISFFYAGWSMGRFYLHRHFERQAAARRAPPSLEAVSDLDLTVELMTRSYCQALDRGDDAQVAMIRRTAEHLPPLRDRLAQVSAERPIVTSFGERAQA